MRGAKTARGQRRPPYVANPDRSRDPPTDKELAAWKLHPLNRGCRARRAGAKLWRKARMGKL